MEISKAIMKITTTAGRLTGKAALSSAQYAWNHRDKIATGTGMAVAATGSAVKGAAGFAYDAASIKLYSNDRTEQLRQSIAAQGKRYRDLVSERLGDGRVVDSLTVGGTCLADIIKDGHASREVEAAFAAQYPHLAAHSTFAEEAAHRYGKDLMGLVSGVKGKLFEIRYVDYLNHGVLPDGYTAHLAESSVQPAWDIAVDGPDGHLSRLLQLKATDSTSYVRQALEHHPDIDVVTTDEVRSHLLMHGGAEHIVGSGVTDHDLTGQVFNATGDAYNMHWSPPLVSLALIAFSAYTLKDATAYGKACHFGERAGKSYLAYLLGGGVTAITGAWWLGLIAGISSRYLAGKGRVQRETYRELHSIYITNQRLINRLA